MNAPPPSRGRLGRGRWFSSTQSSLERATPTEQPGTSLTLWTGYMVDSVHRLFVVGFAPARPGRRKVAQFLGRAIDVAELDIGEADDPVAGECFGDTDGFADQGLTDEDEFATPFDGAVGAHTAHGMIEGPTETIESGLLRGRCIGRRFGGLRFEGCMHAFVAAVLLRRARIGALEPNAEVHPMDWQGRQAARARACEGPTIVRTDRPPQGLVAHS